MTLRLCRASEKHAALHSLNAFIVAVVATLAGAATASDAARQSRRSGRDLGEMSRWLRKAASQGDTMAMIHVARMYDEGFGIERAPKESAKFLMSALKGGAWTVVDQIARFSEETRREVQTVLRQSGHYKGPVEGRIGAETRAAMVEWARG